MESIRDTSRSANTPAGFLLALIAAIAIAMAAPAAGNAAPEPGEPPQLAFEPAAYDFGLQPVNAGSQQAYLQLRNNGPEPVSTESYDLTGPGTDAFWLGYSDCAWRILNPGETCSVQVYFGPYDLATYAAQLRMYASSHAFSADLSGEGGRAILAPASNPVDFGTAAVESTGVTREIEISNLGNMPGGAFIAVISGGAVGSFQLLDENCTGVPLMPAATCTVQVRFRPLSEGAKKATLSLFGDGDPAQVALIGMGSAPEPEPAWDPVEPHGQTQEHSVGPDGSVTTIVRKTIHRVTRPRVKSPKRKSERRHGLRQPRRTGLAQASRLP